MSPSINEYCSEVEASVKPRTRLADALKRHSIDLFIFLHAQKNEPKKGRPVILAFGFSPYKPGTRGLRDSLFADSGSDSPQPDPCSGHVLRQNQRGRGNQTFRAILWMPQLLNVANSLISPLRAPAYFTLTLFPSVAKTIFLPAIATPPAPSSTGLHGGSLPRGARTCRNTKALPAPDGGSTSTRHAPGTLSDVVAAG